MPPKETDALLGGGETAAAAAAADADGKINHHRSNSTSTSSSNRRQIFDNPSKPFDAVFDDYDANHTPKINNISGSVIPGSSMLLSSPTKHSYYTWLCIAMTILVTVLVLNYETVFSSIDHRRYYQHPIIDDDHNSNAEEQMKQQQHSSSSSRHQPTTNSNHNNSKNLRSKIHIIAESIANATAPNADHNANDKDDNNRSHQKKKRSGGGGGGYGPYKLLEAHTGSTFFDYYIFNDGPDSVGSAGYNTYVSKKRATELQLIDVIVQPNDVTATYNDSVNDDDQNDQDHDQEVVVIQSSRGNERDRNTTTGTLLRNSVRLEGKTRFDRGLIIFDVAAMPSGCGIWPAFWTTEEKEWPKYGEIDIVEPINNQQVVKTAMHTTEGCDMYGHVPRWAWTGAWDTATGLPDTYTGELNFENTLEADNCWTLTPHQWFNQGCVAVNSYNNTIGTGINGNGGAVYVLDWDPYNGYIKSWVFPKSNTEENGGIPTNLQQVLHNHPNSNSNKNTNTDIRPNPALWPIPYGACCIYCISESYT